MSSLASKMTTKPIALALPKLNCFLSLFYRLLKNLEKPISFTVFDCLIALAAKIEFRCGPNADQKFRKREILWQHKKQRTAQVNKIHSETLNFFLPGNLCGTPLYQPCGLLGRVTRGVAARKSMFIQSPKVNKHYHFLLQYPSKNVRQRKSTRRERKVV